MSAPDGKLQQLFHFDINGTITSLDTTETSKGDDYINLLMTKNMYGRVENDQWIINDDPYDINSTDKSSIKYRDYLQDFKLPIEMAYTFTKDFNLQEVFEKVKEASNKLIFESFLNVLTTYPHAKIIFRTFGLDSAMIIDHLQNIHNVKRKWINFKITPDSSNEKNQHVLVSEKIEIKGWNLINQFISENTNDVCIIDDYRLWKSNKKDSSYGKPFSHSDKLHQIFFDDNNCVNLMGANKNNNHIIKVNTIQAMIDKSYYTGIIKEILEKNTN